MCASFFLIDVLKLPYSVLVLSPRGLLKSEKCHSHPSATLSSLYRSLARYKAPRPAAP